MRERKYVFAIDLPTSRPPNSSEIPRAEAPTKAMTSDTHFPRLWTTDFYHRAGVAA